MDIWANDAVLSLFPGPNEAYFFDRAGRLTSALQDGWMIQQGLSGRVVAKRWANGQRRVHRLISPEIQHLHEQARTALRHAFQTVSLNAPPGDGPSRPSRDMDQWLWRSLVYDPRDDEKRFRHVYRRVGILPPDQYGACVIQMTEGCQWNRCGFCSFYRGQTFRVKSPGEIQRHIESVAAYLDEGLSLRRSIFLGDANALSAPLDSLRLAMRLIREELVPRMPKFRGVYSFIEVGDSACQSASDFRVLAQEGLRRIYYGLETGDAALRERLGKPSSLAAIAASIHCAKEAGLLVGIILLAGAGGRGNHSRHVQQSLAFLERLPLTPADIVFLSPLRGRVGAGDEPLTSTGLSEQMRQFSAALRPRVRVSPYDLREFVY